MTPREQFLASAELGRLGVPDALRPEEAAYIIARLAATMRCILLDFGATPDVAQEIVSTTARNAVDTARPPRSTPQAPIGLTPCALPPRS